MIYYMVENLIIAYGNLNLVHNLGGFHKLKLTTVSVIVTLRGGVPGHDANFIHITVWLFQYHFFQ